MGGGEGGNLGGGGEVPVRIFRSIPPDSLFQPGDVAPSGVAVFTAHNTHCWAPLCAPGGGIDE